MNNQLELMMDGNIKSTLLYYDLISMDGINVRQVHYPVDQSNFVFPPVNAFSIILYLIFTLITKSKKNNSFLFSNNNHL